MSDKQVNNNGIGFLGLLALIFITLKLCGIIDWSWIWILAPIWMPLVFIFTLFFVIILVLLFFRGYK